MPSLALAVEIEQRQRHRDRKMIPKACAGRLKNELRRSLGGCARRLLGMFRTITNIWGDCCAVTVVEMWARRHDNKLARAAKKADAAKPDVVVGAPPDFSCT